MDEKNKIREAGGASGGVGLLFFDGRSAFGLRPR
jgi:hypothetical protein